MKCYVHPDVDAVGTCSNCGKFVCSSCAVDYKGKVTCKSCVEKMTNASSGIATGSTIAINRKEPIFSLVLCFLGSFVFGLIGLGQLYNGEIKKGIILTLANWFSWFIVIILSFFLIGICLIPVPLLLWVYAMYDAYVTAEKMNRGEPTKDWLS